MARRQQSTCCIRGAYDGAAPHLKEFFVVHQIVGVISTSSFGELEEARESHKNLAACVERHKLLCHVAHLGVTHWAAPATEDTKQNRPGV